MRHPILSLTFLLLSAQPHSATANPLPTPIEGIVPIDASFAAGLYPRQAAGACANGILCGYNNAYCCAAGLVCYTNAANVAACITPTAGAAPAGASVANVVSTVVVTNTAAAGGTGGTGAAPAGCRTDLGQTQCGSGCCDQGLVCQGNGVCVGVATTVTQTSVATTSPSSTG